MKRSILSLAALCLLSYGSQAQSTTTSTSTNQGGFILKGGWNHANISVTPSGAVEDGKALSSFNVGFALDLPLAQGLSLQPGLLYTGKGSKTQQGNTSDNSYYRATSNPTYVELPVNLVGKIPLGGSANFIIGGGAYGAVGVSGKNKVESRVFGLQNNYESDIKFSDDDPTTSREENAGYGKLKRFDYGLNGLAGIDFGKLILSANYGYGLAKINSGTSNRADDNNKHRVFSVNVGLKL